VIERGVVAQQGTFDELLAQPGAFRRLVERQLAELEPAEDDASDDGADGPDAADES
jgi:hypothetical protein